jgi:hypothetical protein
MAAVSSVSALQEKTMVYNLSVEGSHTYSVSQAGVLVHNKALQAKPVASATTPLAPRQIAAEWGVNTYRHGGQMSAIEHINYRHAFNSGFKDVSRYAEGTSVRQIKGYVDDALQYGKVTPNGANGFQIEHSLGRVIGTDQAGKAANGIRVFVRHGTQTAFPIP